MPIKANQISNYAKPLGKAQKSVEKGIKAMRIAIETVGEKPVFMPDNAGWIIWRAFRAALWARGIKRDPMQGDEIDGVRIVALTL